MLCRFGWSSPAEAGFFRLGVGGLRRALSHARPTR